MGVNMVVDTVCGFLFVASRIPCLRQGDINLTLLSDRATPIHDGQIVCLSVKPLSVQLNFEFVSTSYVKSQNI